MFWKLTDKMKIALLNLPFDNNYGGNLQRYAFVKVLQNMGHDVVHINLRRNYHLLWYRRPLSYAKRLVRKYFMGDDLPVNLERHLSEKAEQDNWQAEIFYAKYIPHTKKVYDIVGICETCRSRAFDAYIVGSDQVCRYDMTKSIGLNNYLLDFTKHQNVRRIAYAVSMGNQTRLSGRLVSKLTKSYSRFSAVSVREQSALEILKSYGWEYPYATWVLDPTLLLIPTDYSRLIADGVTEPQTIGKFFCYVLDMSDAIRSLIAEKETEYYAEAYVCGLHSSVTVSIEQWLRNISDSRMVITDSFHGVVFSILFNKPFLFLGNEVRGNARVDSLFEMLGIDRTQTTSLDWKCVNYKISEWRVKSFDFLINSLK